MIPATKEPIAKNTGSAGVSVDMDVMNDDAVLPYDDAELLENSEDARYQ